MLLSVNWLREFVPYEGDIDVLAEKLTMLGLEVDQIYNPFEQLMGLVVGHVLECEKHPEADKLHLCQVDVGEEVLPIVCGAPNIAKGQKICVAKVGTVLPGDFKIKKSKIRGQVSLGMICSERELELSENHDGIMVLDESLEPGANFVEALGLEQNIIEIDLTPNRADCLSIYGIAREVAMAFDLPLKKLECTLNEDGPEKSEDLVTVEIDDAESCPLFQIRVIKGVEVKQSPDWLRYRLLSVGLRPINNIVDATNYVLMELGQPQHAYDLNLLEGGKIRVTHAENGMKTTTLDGQERELLATDLCIWDDKKIVGLAGVMGGANTEMNDASKDVALECAIFHSGTIRKTARRLALHSDASHRFERGVDQLASPWVVDRTAALIKEIAGGTICIGRSAKEPKPYEERSMTFRTVRAEMLLGIELGDEFCERTLTALGCTISEKKDGIWTVIAPSHRLDLEREVDLIEEVGRVYGLDRIPAVLPVVPKGEATGDEKLFWFLSDIKHWGRGLGMAEAVNYSFVSPRELDLLGEPEEGRVTVANPLSEDQSVMRTVLAPGLLANLRQNIGQGNPNMRLFEVAKIFHEDKESDTMTREQDRLAIMLHGNRFGSGFPWPQEESDYSDLKGIAEDFLRTLHLPEATFTLVEDHAWMQPCVDVSIDGTTIGQLGRVKDSVAAEYKARNAVWMADFYLGPIVELCEKSAIQFENLAKFPSTKRDLTVVAPMGLNVSEVFDVVGKQKAPLLAGVTLVDEYIPEGGEERNLTFRFTFRSPTKTLKDKEADKAQKNLTNAILKALPVKLQ